MRFTVDQSDKDFHPAITHMVITVNGVVTKTAIEVNDAAGTVREIVGFDEATGQKIVQTRRGVIRIQVPHEHAFYPGWPKLPARYIGRPIFTPPPGIGRVR